MEKCNKPQFGRDENSRFRKRQNNHKPENTPRHTGKTNPEANQPAPRTTIRLNRYISNAGICSRREADKIIASGDVTVNGKTVTELGIQVKPSDDVRYKGRRLNPETKVYVLLNKPKDCVTTAHDPQGRITVLNIVEDACEERIFPVGRLDRQTTGLLLLTNDGDLAKKLTHPSTGTKKIYHIFTQTPVRKEHIQQIANGFELEDGFIKADDISYVDGDETQVGLEIHSGKNRIVRRIFEHLGYNIVKLDRVYFAGLTKKNLPRGKWRHLTQQEVTFLKAGILG